VKCLNKDEVIQPHSLIGRKIIDDTTGNVGVIRNILFLYVERLYPVALEIDLNGEKIEIPISSVRMENGELKTRFGFNMPSRVIIQPDKYFITREAMKVILEVLPRAFELIKDTAKEKDSESLSFEVSVNNVLLRSKCPICMGEIAFHNEFTFCPSCLTPYHPDCIIDILKSRSTEMCWVCDKTRLTDLLIRNRNHEDAF
jgi:hypothetical protein